MKAEDIALAEARAHYADLYGAGSSVSDEELRQTRMYIKLARVIREAEERGYQQAKADYCRYGEASTGEKILPRHNALVNIVHAMDDRLTALENVSVATSEGDKRLADMPRVNIAAASVHFSGGSNPAHVDLPPRPSVPLFVTFEEADDRDGVAIANFADPKQVAQHISGLFCQPINGRLGFRDGSGQNIAVAIALPNKLDPIVAYIRNAVRDIVESVITERDVAWSVALAEAGLDPAPLIPDVAGECVENFEQQIAADRDGQWFNAFAAFVRAEGEGGPADTAITPYVPAGVAAALKDHARRIRRDMLAHTNAKCEAAAKTARRRERDACYRIAQVRGDELLSQAENLGRFILGRRAGIRAHGALDVAEAILARDDEDVSLPDEAPAQTFTPGR